LAFAFSAFGSAFGAFGTFTGALSDFASTFGTFTGAFGGFAFRSALAGSFGAFSAFMTFRFVSLGPSCAFSRSGSFAFLGFRRGEDDGILRAK
jgi:hypothetical protein